jgi:hypothetical protein
MKYLLLCIDIFVIGTSIFKNVKNFNTRSKDENGLDDINVRIILIRH